MDLLTESSKNSVADDERGRVFNESYESPLNRRLWLWKSEDKGNSEDTRNGIVYGQRVAAVNEIDDSLEGKNRKTRIDHAGSSTSTLKPTTMRGPPLDTLTSATVTRGFYITKIENDTSSSITTSEKPESENDSSSSGEITTVSSETHPTDETDTTLVTLKDTSKSNLTSEEDIKESGEEELRSYVTVKSVLDDSTVLSKPTTVSLVSEAMKNSHEISETTVPVSSKLTGRVASSNDITTAAWTEKRLRSRTRVTSRTPTTLTTESLIRTRGRRVSFSASPTDPLTPLSSTTPISEVPSSSLAFVNSTVPESSATTVVTSATTLRNTVVSVSTPVDPTVPVSSVSVTPTTLAATSYTIPVTYVNSTNPILFIPATSAKSQISTNAVTSAVTTTTSRDFTTQPTVLNPTFSTTTPESSENLTTERSPVYTSEELSNEEGEQNNQVELNQTVSSRKEATAPTLTPKLTADENGIDTTTFDYTLYNSQDLFTRKVETDLPETTVQSITNLQYEKKDTTTYVESTTVFQDENNDSTEDTVGQRTNEMDSKIETDSRFSTSTPATESPRKPTEIAKPETSSTNDEIPSTRRPIGRRRQRIRVNYDYEFGRRFKPHSRRVINRTKYEETQDTEEDNSRTNEERKNYKPRVVITRDRHVYPNRHSAIEERRGTRVVRKRIRKPVEPTIESAEDSSNLTKESQSKLGAETNTPKKSDGKSRAVINGETHEDNAPSERPSEEVSQKNVVPTTRKPGSFLANRLRKPLTTASPAGKLPSTLASFRNNKPSDTILRSTTEINNTEETGEVSEQMAKEDDQKPEVDQSSRAQELAVTLTNPPNSSQSSSGTGRLPLRDVLRRKISTTISPRTESTTRAATPRFTSVLRNRQDSKSKEKKPASVTARPRRPPIIDYDYYEDEEEPVIRKPTLGGKIFFSSRGNIRCLDQGNFPHPYSCKKFITCARMVNGQVIGAEYTCPDRLSFDPVGGICNWSAGLGCKE